MKNLFDKFMVLSFIVITAFAVYQIAQLNPTKAAQGIASCIIEKNC